MTPPLWLYTLCIAEAMFLFARGKDLQIVIRAKRHLSDADGARITRGLRRDLALEFFVMVPASAAVTLALSPFVFMEPHMAALLKAEAAATYSLLGLVSYGFPYVAVRSFIQRIALAALQEVAASLPRPNRERNSSFQPRMPILPRSHDIAIQISCRASG